LCHVREYAYLHSAIKGLFMNAVHLK
jgi:hypothetical protein